MNYQKYANKAYDKIKRYGSAIIISHSGNKEYNRETDEYEEVVNSVLGVAIQRNYNQRDIDGTNIRIGDINFMASLNGKVYSNDVIEFEGNTYTVIRAIPLNPDGKTDIFWNIQAR
jgi:hypothetical protein